jgi:hypothetical protein
MRRNWILIYGITVHYLWGAALLLSADPVGATPLTDWRRLPHAVAGLTLATLATLALTGMLQARRRGPSMRSLLLLLPQSSVIVFSGLSSLTAILTSHYADGVPRPHLFIGADQIGVVVIAVLHTWALVEMHIKAAPPDVLKDQLADLRGLIGESDPGPR